MVTVYPRTSDFWTLPTTYKIKISLNWGPEVYTFIHKPGNYCTLKFEKIAVTVYVCLVWTKTFPSTWAFGECVFGNRFMWKTQENVISHTQKHLLDQMSYNKRLLQIRYQKSWLPIHEYRFISWSLLLEHMII